MIWDPIRKEGNPTRSSEVNDVITKVKKFEVRKEGVVSKARRPLEYDEFINLMKMLRNDERLTMEERFEASCVLSLQWHLIARIDDLMKLKFENISGNAQNNFTLLCKMRWSKNITEEREAPEQVILGSMDKRLCPLLNLAVFIETKGHNLGHTHFLFDKPTSGHQQIRKQLNDIFESDEFTKVSKIGLLLIFMF